MEKFQYFDGKKFVLDEDKGYFKCGTVYMHRYVWEYHNGPIPEGYEIHHKDLNRANNKIENLECLECCEHKKLHANNRTPEQQEWYRNHMNTTVHEASKAWHKSEAGSEWHSEHIKEQRNKGAFKKTLICTNCGKTYVGEKHGPTNFCSNACKSAYRRKIGADLVPAVCVCCGKYFQTSKLRPAKTCSRSCTNRYRARLKHSSNTLFN